MRTMVLGLLMNIIASPVTYAMEVETRLNPKTGENLALIKNPTHNSSNFPFSPQSDYEAHAICKYLGYERFVPNSVEMGNQRTDVIHLNSNGTVNSAPLDYPMLEIICVNKQQAELLETSIVVKNPFHSELMIPFAAFNADAAQGVCKYLGHDRFALNSGDFGDEVTNVLILNRDGSIMSASREYPIAQIVCIDKL